MLQTTNITTCLVTPTAIHFYFKLDNPDYYDTIMEEMDTEDQPSTKSSGDSAINAKDAKTGVETDDKKAQPFTLRQLVSSADLRRPLLIACMLQAVQQFSGINAVSVLHHYTHFICLL
jgi:Sugar (and other) transporter